MGALDGCDLGESRLRALLGFGGGRGQQCRKDRREHGCRAWTSCSSCLVNTSFMGGALRLTAAIYEASEPSGISSRP